MDVTVCSTNGITVDSTVGCSVVSLIVKVKFTLILLRYELTNHVNQPDMKLINFLTLWRSKIYHHNLNKDSDFIKNH